MGGVWSRRLGATVGAGLVALSVAGVAAATAAAAAPGRPCWQRGAGHIRCLRVTVPLDRGGVLPGTIGLRVRVQPAVAGTPSETILALAGGPGQAAAPLLGDFADMLGGNALRSRRLVTFDQRGTGGSGRLRCPELASLPDDEALSPGDEVQRVVSACASRLGPARAHYATADSVEDVEAVRSALGVERLTLFGISYGTKVALDYAAAYPQHVGRLVLDSVVLPGGVDPFLRTTLGSIPRVLRTLCAPRRCRFTRDAGADVAALVDRLSHGPLRGYRVDGRGHRRSAAIVRGDVFSLLLAGDLDPYQRSLVPAAVRGALDGDPALLLRLAALSGASLDADGGDSDAVYLATTCADGGVPWASGTPIAARPAAIDAALAAIPPAQLAPFGSAGVRDLGFADLCRSWPEAPVSQAHRPLPDVPALILSGDQDLRTPRADALALASQLPSARVVTVPRTGHSALGSDFGSCAQDAVAGFLAGRAARACQPRRLDPLDAPAGLPPRRLAALRPLPGLPAPAGRTVAAVGTTFALLERLVVAELLATGAGEGEAGTIRVGGLRGGSIVFGRRTMMMRRYSVVPGVALSARIGDSRADSGADDPLILRVGGRAAARGSLRIGEHWVTGRLGGHRVRLRTAVLERSVAGASAAHVARIARRARLGGTPPPPVASLPAPLRALLGWG
jgi:pimeloyl-ACP methyl ester carboxylesterase